MMTPEAEAAWAALTGQWGQPLNINSGYRDPEHNARVGGAKNSQHTHGNAYDVDVANLSPEERQRLARLARASGFRGVGVYDNSMHFDVGSERAWGPSYGRESLPSEFAWLLNGGGVSENPMGSISGQVQEQNRMGEYGQPQAQDNRLQLAYGGLDPANFMSRRRFG